MSYVNKYDAPRSDLPGTQVTVSEGHPFHSRNKGDRTDIGGDFLTQKQYIEGSDFRVSRSEKRSYPNGNSETVTYDGPFLPVYPANVSFPPFDCSSPSEMDALGTTAIARCKPTNSVADAAVFLGELYKEGLPSLVGSTLWKDRTRATKKAGDEYLNVQFGWTPLVNEISKFADGVRRADAVLAQYERDAGRVVRRRFNFPEHKERNEWTLSTWERAYTNPSTSFWTQGAPYGTLVKVREKTQRQWFSGAFTYALPSGYDSRNRLHRAALKAEQVFGLKLTPEVLWNLAPWSWAADWFFNVGDVLANVSDMASSGLVMQYGYMMEHTIVKDTYTLSPSGHKNLGECAPLSFVSETKQRKAANPFGFGLTWDGLSPYQLSIAAALGLSRGR